MRRLYFFLLVVFFVMVCLSGCTGFLRGNGAVNQSPSVTAAFETFQINPNYNYYYSGSYVYPNALIGLDKKYKIEPELWKKMDAPKDFKDIITQMQSKALSIGQFQHGFVIADDKGRPIGTWYSILGATTSVRMKDDTTVLIYQPPLDTYEKYEQERVRPR